MSVERKFYGLGAIGQTIGKPTHTVRYICESRGIEPVGKAGQAKIYTDEQLSRIAAEARALDAKAAERAAAGAVRRANRPR